MYDRFPLGTYATIVFCTETKVTTRRSPFHLSRLPELNHEFQFYKTVTKAPAEAPEHSPVL